MEIKNKVANSKLVTIDLEDFYPLGERILFDIKDWLFKEQVLIEKEFRKNVANHNWSVYKDAFVALYCSVDVIIPAWAYLLISTKLAPFSKRIIVGTIKDIETVLYTKIISKLDVSVFKDKYILIKGCTTKPIPETAYVQLIEKLIPVVKSIMYGEACSNVPLYKVKINP